MATAVMTKLATTMFQVVKLMSDMAVLLTREKSRLVANATP
jgi:hypothetical protein